jgi:opacity protein-like surface antigen
LKLKLALFTTVLAFAGMAHAQGIVSNLSIGAGFEGIFPAATFTRAQTLANFTAGGTQSSTNSIGAVADLRYDFGRHSAVGFSFTFNRNTEYFVTANVDNNHVQTNNSEMIGTYIFRLPANERVKPFALFGGGMVRFSPNNDFVTTGTPSSETKPAFAYGFGTDFKLSDHWGLRLQYRGLVRADPDFKLTPAFGTALRAHVPEPSIQAVYHF